MDSKKARDKKNHRSVIKKNGKGHKKKEGRKKERNKEI